MLSKNQFNIPWTESASSLHPSLFGTSFGLDSRLHHKEYFPSFSRFMLVFKTNILLMSKISTLFKIYSNSIIIDVGVCINGKELVTISRVVRLN